MIVLVTGQVGLEKSKYLAQVKKLVIQKNIKCELITVGEKLIEIYPGKINEKSILNLPLTELTILRRATWKEILQLSEWYHNKEDSILLINSHAVFRWHHGLFPAIDLILVEQIKPDIIVTLIDDIDKIKKGLQKRGTDFFQLWELMAWREEEIWFTKFLTESINSLSTSSKTKFLILPKDPGPTLLFKILTEPHVDKIYLSFPITGTSQKEKGEIESFKTRVTDKFVCFDPLKLKEREIYNLATFLISEMEETLVNVKKELDKIKNNFKVNEILWNVSWDKFYPLVLSQLKKDDLILDGREIFAILDAINSQIISRDFLFIEQSDFIVAYIPRLNNKPLISAGSQTEITYSYSKGKPVYVIYPGMLEDLSPWVTMFSRVFNNLEEFFDFITNKNKIRDRKK